MPMTVLTRSTINDRSPEESRGRAGAECAQPKSRVDSAEVRLGDQTKGNAA